MFKLGSACCSRCAEHRNNITQTVATSKQAMRACVYEENNQAIAMAYKTLLLVCSHSIQSRRSHYQRLGAHSVNLRSILTWFKPSCHHLAPASALYKHSTLLNVCDRSSTTSSSSVMPALSNGSCARHVLWYASVRARF
jgi:hypothetical protein